MDGDIVTLDFPILRGTGERTVSQRNFPVKSLYSPRFGECYTFYRQGYVFTIDMSPKYD